MSTQVQFRRGTTAETNVFVGASGEVTVDTTKNICVVHDGSTSGGFPLLRQDGTNSLLSAGSLTSPSLKFSNSTTTGIYSPSPGSISIVNNGVANLTIDSSGAVNIPGNFLLSGNLSLPQGTVASPSLKIGPGTQGFYSPTTEQLAISIGSTQRALFTGQLFNWGPPTGDCGIQIGDGATANRSAYLDLVGDTTYTDYGLRLIRNNAGPNATSVLSHRGTGSLILTTQEAAPITFQTTGLERARITASGNFGVGTSSPISPLDVVGTVSVRPVVSGDGGILQVYGNAGAAAGVTIKSTFSTGGHGPLIFDLGNGEKCRIDASGRLLWGTSAARVFTSALTPIAQFHSTGSDSSVGACRWSADVNQPFFVLSKSRGATVGTQAAVASGDAIGTVLFTADDGTSFIQAARISALVDGTPGTNDMPGRLIFSTTPAGSVNPVERMRIDSAGNIGIGGAAPAGYSFLNTKTLTGATTTFGQVNQGVVQSDCTTAAVYFASNAQTQAAAFTVGSIYHYQTQQGTFGAGSAVTDQVGFRASGTLIGATNNYGFLSLIPSGTGRWNFYSQGTADSYFASNNFIFANGGTEKARFDSSGRLLVGTSAARTNFYGSITPNGIQNEIGYGTFFNNSANATGSAIYMGKSRGTAAGSNTLVQSGDQLGAFVFFGADGSNAQAGAQIIAEVDGTPGLNDMPGRLVLSTTLDGASTPTEQWRINNAGTVIYNQPAPAAVDTSATLTVANLTAKIITSSTAAAVTMTLPLGTSMDTGFSGLYTNMAFEWYVINTGATNAVTVQANTGHTIVGSATVAASNSGKFLSRRTAANTWVTYRLSS